MTTRRAKASPRLSLPIEEVDVEVQVQVPEPVIDEVVAEEPLAEEPPAEEPPTVEATNIFLGEEDRRLLRKFNKHIVNKLGLTATRSFRV